MSRQFNGLGSFALHLLTLEVGIMEALHLGLERVAEQVKTTAQREIGHYQAETGPFPEWPLLADSTEDRKAQMGYPSDAPLLATGEMRDGISHQVEGLEAVIGSPDERMVFHEFGTAHMPARPVMGPAAFTNRRNIEKLVGAALVAGLIGEERVHQALGYSFETKD